ncbi:MAG TPA: class I SAM-dependent methyltransferase [Solirubrobacterales bacterium]|nr:class I SAM-dependent methyltransferase [Solirubrobacterales bacterium]
MAADKFTVLTPELHRYAVEHSSFRDGFVPEIERAGEAMGDLALMQIAGDQAALMTILVRATGARHALEVGTFLGYGALAIARGLPDDGTLVCCELDEGYAARAREHLERAGFADRVEFRLGPAAETLEAMDEDGSLDFAFVDADKAGYPAYFEQCLRLLRPGGLILLDNVFMGGRILDPPEGDEGAAAVAELNDRLAADDRIEVAMLGMADGITIARKR